MYIRRSKLFPMLAAFLLFVVYLFTSPQNHSEAEDVYDFALRVEQGTFAEQAGVNRVLALPAFGIAYKTAQACGYTGRAFPFMIFMNRLMAVLCIFLFWHLVSYCRRPAGSETTPLSHPPIFNNQHRTPILFLAFSYGFWRYANEAETYILASLLVLVSWCLVIDQRPTTSVQHAAGEKVFKRWACSPSSVLCPLVSALGCLVHLLNLIPLLLIIPLYYLLSKDWKKAVLHGVLTGGLVVMGYAVCSPWLDFSELGAQHHGLEGGLSFANLLRGGIAFGQCLVSGNFLLGFEWFRTLLIDLFPSRMLGEEFFMATHMPGWIKWAGVATLLILSVCVFQLVIRICKAVRTNRGELFAVHGPLLGSAFVWILLYVVAVIRTEAGSPELWIMALIPFWLIVATLLDPSARSVIPVCNDGSGKRKNLSAEWVLVVALFAHNLVGGLLPVMSEESDYHVAKGAWLTDRVSADDLILTDYEPVMIFYLDYFTEAKIINSGRVSLNKINQALEFCSGNVYALASFFKPMESMKIRKPITYDKMLSIGDYLQPRFEKAVEDEFGGIYSIRFESNTF